MYYIIAGLVLCLAILIGANFVTANAAARCRPALVAEDLMVIQHLASTHMCRHAPPCPQVQRNKDTGMSESGAMTIKGSDEAVKTASNDLCVRACVCACPCARA